jgi:hypothetical protein
MFGPQEATDHIPHEVGKALLNGFIEGLGIVSPLFDLAIELLCSPRLILLDHFNEVFESRRGVFMGEPLTKTVLTLLNLCCEEVSIRKFLHLDFETPVQVSWRCFAVGGDDHIAYGPLPYLEGITETHLRAGSMISDTKHSISTKLVNYCEKLLEVSKFRSFTDPQSVNNGVEGYRASPFIDSIKVRLLSPCSKNIDIVNDRNTAIGKGRSLGKTLRWLNSVTFPTKWVKMVRDRFFHRMGRFLPVKSSGVYWHLLLPGSLGGLGLWLEDDIVELQYKLPAVTKSLIEEITNCTISASFLDAVRGLTSNSSFRGYDIDTNIRGKLIEQLREILWAEHAPMEWREVRLLADNPYASAREVARDLVSKHILPQDEIEDRVLRPFLFNEILSKKARSNPYNTEDLKKRYARIWDSFYDGETNLSEESLRKILVKGYPLPWYDLSHRFLAPDPVFGSSKKNLIELITTGMPVLSIEWNRVSVIT